MKDVSSDESCRYSKMINWGRAAGEVSTWRANGNVGEEPRARTWTTTLVMIVRRETPTRSLSFFRQCETSDENARNSKLTNEGGGRDVGSPCESEGETEAYSV